MRPQPVGWQPLISGYPAVLGMMFGATLASLEGLVGRMCPMFFIRTGRIKQRAALKSIPLNYLVNF
jgi:hypothetical protein